MEFLSYTATCEPFIWRVIEILLHYLSYFRVSNGLKHKVTDFRKKFGYGIFEKFQERGFISVL